MTKATTKNTMDILVVGIYAITEIFSVAISMAVADIDPPRAHQTRFMKVACTRMTKHPIQIKKRRRRNNPRDRARIPKVSTRYCMETSP